LSSRNQRDAKLAESSCSTAARSPHAASPPTINDGGVSGAQWLRRDISARISRRSHATNCSTTSLSAGVIWLDRAASCRPRARPPSACRSASWSRANRRRPICCQLGDDRLPLSDLSPSSVDGDDHRLVERREQMRRQVFRGPNTGGCRIGPSRSGCAAAARGSSPRNRRLVLDLCPLGLLEPRCRVCRLPQYVGSHRLWYSDRGGCGVWRNGHSRSADRSGRLPAPRAPACVDRQFAEVEFRSYIRAGCYYQYRTLVIRNNHHSIPMKRRLVASPALPLIARFGLPDRRKYAPVRSRLKPARKRLI